MRFLSWLGRLGGERQPPAAPRPDAFADQPGTVTFTFDSAPPVTLSALAVNAAFLACHDREPASPMPGFIAWLRAAGFPPMSWMGAGRVIQAAQDELDRLRLEREIWRPVPDGWQDQPFAARTGPD